MMQMEEIKAAVLRLTPEDQAEIVDTILANIADPGPLSDSWKAELDRRGREIDEGTVELIDNEDVFAYVRSRLR